ncbi:MAG: type II secretion system protein GspM [Steroidobacteraceae bacterium]
MQEWLARLDARERRVLFIGAIAAAVILLAATIFQVQRKVSQVAQRVEHKRADLQSMQAAAAEIATAGPAPAAPASRESLVVIIDRSARESGLGSALASSQPSGDGALQVRLEGAPFDALVAWLARLADQNAVRVESASIDAAGTGLVNAGLVLRAR